MEDSSEGRSKSTNVAVRLGKELEMTGSGMTAAHRTSELLRDFFGHENMMYRLGAWSSNSALCDSSRVRLRCLTSPWHQYRTPRSPH